MTPRFNQAPQYVVTAVNPYSGAVAMETFVDGDYIDWDGSVRNDEVRMNDFVRDLVMKKYPVVVTQTKLDEIRDSVQYQVVINIHPHSVVCDCGKGILCPLNTQHVNYFKGDVVTREALV